MFFVTPNGHQNKQQSHATVAFSSANPTQKLIFDNCTYYY